MNQLGDRCYSGNPAENTIMIVMFLLKKGRKDSNFLPISVRLRIWGLKNEVQLVSKKKNKKNIHS